jgi:hypothetical protein
MHAGWFSSSDELSCTHVHHHDNPRVTPSLQSFQSLAQSKLRLHSIFSPGHLVRVATVESLSTGNSVAASESLVLPVERLEHANIFQSFET